MKVILIFRNAGGTITTCHHDLSIMKHLPDIGDKVIEVEHGIVTDRVFDYLANLVTIYIKVN